jgi:glycerate dehydrogenase
MSDAPNRIVVLDGHTLNPGDLSWDALGTMGELTVHDRTPSAQVVERAANAEIIFTNKSLLPAEAIEALPALRYIGVLATGYNVVDTAAARACGIPVTNIPGYGTAAVAQMTMALLLELASQPALHSASVRDGDWCTCPDFCYWKKPLVELDGLTLGLVGFGAIGQAVAKLARAFGMKVMVNTRTPCEVAGIEFVDRDQLFREADVVSLHCPLTHENKGFVNAALLATMKPTAFFINTARGPLVDEAALAEALNREEIARAATDVLSVEPPAADNSLFSAKNLIITPHIGWATRAARERLMGIAVDNLRAFLAGAPTNVVNEHEKQVAEG